MIENSINKKLEIITNKYMELLYSYDKKSLDGLNTLIITDNI